MKTFILDTNVLLHDPMAVERFGDETVIVPIVVIEEIDRFKRELSERGRNARMISRRLDELRESGSLADGVKTSAGGIIRVAFLDPSISMPVGMESVATRRNGADDVILAVALQVKQKANGSPVVLVTRDVNLRIRADAMGLQTVDYLDKRVDISEMYSGMTEIDVPAADVDKIYADGSIPFESSNGMYANQCVLLRDETNPQHTAVSTYIEQDKTLRVLGRFQNGIWGIRPRNKEQHFAFDLLMNDDIKLVTLVGKAGTGKTLLAIAAGLERSLETRTYKKLLVSRPIFPLGKDIGFLPGDVEEKLNPWMKPIFDNLELLLGIGHQDDKERSYRDFIDMGYIEVEPLTYIRGRSIPNQFIIVDEAQNLTPLEVKTIITRAGENTKIVLTGDPYQIDNPYVDSSNNGLSTIVERFKDQQLAGHVTLEKGERSALAAMAANVLQ